MALSSFEACADPRGGGGISDMSTLSRRTRERDLRKSQLRLRRSRRRGYRYNVDTDEEVVRNRADPAGPDRRRSDDDDDLRIRHRCCTRPLVAKAGRLMLVLLSLHGLVSAASGGRRCPPCFAFSGGRGIAVAPGDLHRRRRGGSMPVWVHPVPGAPSGDGGGPPRRQQRQRGGGTKPNPPPQRGGRGHVIDPSSPSSRHHGGGNNNINNDNNNNKTTTAATRKKIRSMFRRAQDLTRTGRWSSAARLLRDILDLDPRDAHSYLALARLESRREGASSTPPSSSNGTSSSTGGTPPSGTSAREIFRRGTRMCPDSVHLLQAWAVHERDLGNIDSARKLFEGALDLDGMATNPYVCHAYGLMEHRLGNNDRARELWTRALAVHPTAALVCSLGALETTSGSGGVHRGGGDGDGGTTTVAPRRRGNATAARELYLSNVDRLSTDRERTEVYLAAAWLEESHFRDVGRAAELVAEALARNPGNSRARLALARLEGRMVTGTMGAAAVAGAAAAAAARGGEVGGPAHAVRGRGVGGGKLNGGGGGAPRGTGGRTDDGNAAVRRRLAEACESSSSSSSGKGRGGRRRWDRRDGARQRRDDGDDGRLFNAWAKLEAKNGRLARARRILEEGSRQYPRDHSILQAAGNVEERIGNFSAARDFYGASLLLEPSAPTLVSYAMLEMRHPEKGVVNVTMVRRLFEEALLLDSRHGPAYNAYGTMELRRGDVDRARVIFERGIQSYCNDPASVFHGYAKVELATGNVERAREILLAGLREVRSREGIMMESKRRDRAVFLVHTLGMLELNSNRVVHAKKIFDDGIRRHGNSSRLLLGAALCNVKLGKQDSARVFFKRAVDCDRKHAHAWQAWGCMEMRAGNFQHAKTLFECGIRGCPGHGALWHAYGTMESKRGNFEAARVIFAAGIQKCPSHVGLHQAWACLELKAGNFNRAKRLIGSALTKDKTQGTGWIIAAKIEEKLGNEGLVGLILRRGLECAPTYADLYCSFAEFQIKRGKMEEARQLLEKGIEVNPLHAPLYHSLAELEARVFNLEGLAKLNKRAAEVFNNNALVPPKASTWAFGEKMKKGRSRNVPDGIAALAERVGNNVEEDQSLIGINPASLIETMTQFEDDVLGDIFSTSSDVMIDGEDVLDKT